MTRNATSFFALALSTALVLGCGAKKEEEPAQPTPPVTTQDLVDTAAKAGQFQTLLAAAQGAGLESTLRGAGPFTLFAPTDEAFRKVPDFLLSKLITAPYKTELGLILKYHVLPGRVLAGDIGGKRLEPVTAAGARLSVDGTGGAVTLSGGVKVQTADVLAKNGVIHVLDGVLMPTLLDTAAHYKDEAVSFSTLATAVGAAGLEATLSGTDPLTVFAPTDAAFAALKAEIGEAAFAAILADKAQLTRILTYHVLPAAVFSKDVKSGAVKTVEGSELRLTVAEGEVRIADGSPAASQVVLSDVPARNGVIHVIDKVLLPPMR